MPAPILGPGRPPLELDRDHGWKADVESALERLLAVASLCVTDIEQKSTVGVL
ncbi:hypothetical protein [Rhodococcus sp. NPDC058514]|uniref:hypothetical protein n=1 Tax=Rhodococcus sp. NPDC058514 TaxID=3346532 RepID=UPI0036498459